MSGNIVRCAIYTRKSTEEGLEQDFNSLDAQRESCAAYIASHKAEGWIRVKDRFDDGGYSGGTLVRPALKQLLEAIELGAVDVVVVPLEPFTDGLRQVGGNVRSEVRDVRLSHPILQYHHFHGSSDAERAFVFRAI